MEQSDEARKLLIAQQAIAELKADGKRKIQFINAISHDLRTPLNALVLECANAQLAMRETDYGSVNEALTNIERSAETLAHMLNRFLELGRIDYLEDVNKFEDINIITIVDRLRVSFRAEADKKGIGFSFTGDLFGSITTDLHKFERIMLNLISNAIKFTETGSVEIIVRHVTDGLSVAVKDTGIGIPIGDYERLFAEFYQGQNHERSKKKGFGLGLCISRRLARQLGGDLRLASSSTAGTEFRLFIPKPKTGTNSTPPDDKPIEHIAC